MNAKDAKCKCNTLYTKCETVVWTTKGPKYKWYCFSCGRTHYLDD